MPLGFPIVPIGGRPTAAQHLEDGASVLPRRRLVRRVIRVAQDLAVLLLAIDPRARVIQVLVRRALKPGPQHVAGLCREGGPTLRHGRDRDLVRLQELVDLGLAHPPTVR